MNMVHKTSRKLHKLRILGLLVIFMDDSKDIKVDLEVFIDDEDEILEKTISGNYYTLVLWHHGDGIYQDSHFSGACAARWFLA